MGWRTMLIVPELQMELAHAAACESTQRRLAALRQQRDAVEEAIHRAEWAEPHTGGAAGGCATFCKCLLCSGVD